MNNIVMYSSGVLNYTRDNSNSDAILKTDFIKGALIRIYSSYTHLFIIFKKDFDSAKKAIKTFDDLCEKLSINERSPYFELVLKIKGDYAFYTNDNISAIQNYEKAIRLMNDRNPRKPIVCFNLGCMYYLNGNKTSAVLNLQKSVNLFESIERDKRTFDNLQKRNREKISIAKNILNELCGRA